jgi:isoleucyl-tRNA synthetase
VARFEAGERVEIEVQGSRHALQPDDVVIHRQARGDLVVQTDGEVVAALDATLTDALKQEGLAREIVSRVQRMRRDAGLDVTDRIRIAVDGDEVIRTAVQVHHGYISEETLALDLALVAGGNGSMQDVDLDGVTAKIAISKVDGK